MDPGPGGGIGAPVMLPPPVPLPAKPSGMGVASEAKRIDVISRVMFPLSFAGFNVMYWAYYLTKSYYSSGLHSKM